MKLLVQRAQITFVDGWRSVVVEGQTDLEKGKETKQTNKKPKRLSFEIKSRSAPLPAEPCPLFPHLIGTGDQLHWRGPRIK